MVQSQSDPLDSHLTTWHVHEPDDGHPGSAQQMPGAPSTEGLQGTVLAGPATLHWHVPSTLTYMSLHEIEPPDDPPEPDPEDEDALPLDVPDPPPDDPEEELADASTAAAHAPPCDEQ